MRNKKGVTIVELIVSFVLISIIVFFLFQIIIIMKELYFSYGIKTELYTKQTIISDKIYKDLKEKRIASIYNCSDINKICLKMIFTDGSSKDLSFDIDDKSISYGNYVTKLLDGTTFEDMNFNENIKTATLPYQPFNQYDSVLVINVPIYHPLITKRNSDEELENFGINIVYQYNSRNTYIDLNSNLPDNNSDVATLLLEDSVTMIKDTIEGGIIKEPGYIIYTEEGEFIYSNDTEDFERGDYKVVRTTTCNSNTLGSCTMNYSLLKKAANGSYIDILNEERNVEIIEVNKTFAFTGNQVTYSAPISGTYEIEIWGAEGGTGIHGDIGGKGGYTKATVELDEGDNLLVSVGGKANNSIGGYNGGGTASRDGGGGGGATIISKNDQSTVLIVAGGGGGGGSDHAANTTYKGGTGGGESGTPGKCEGTGNCVESYIGLGGTNTSGGSGGEYAGFSSASGISFKGADAEAEGGAGGGGYYGGGAGTYYGSGGGGSGYCNSSLLSCTTIDGLASFLNPFGILETGHSGNGYAKITLKEYYRIQSTID